MRGDSLGGNVYGDGGVRRASERAGGNGASSAQGPPAFVPEAEPEGLTLRDYMAVIWRRKWVIILVVAVATASAYYFSSRQVKQYSADGTLLYRQQINLSNPLTGAATDATGLDREMATIGDLMAGPVLQDRATVIIHELEVDAAAGFSITAAQQASAAGSSSSAGSNVVLVTADSPSPELAAAAANAYMKAYVEWDAEQSQNQIKGALLVIQSQLSKYTSPETKLSADYVLLRQRLQDLQILSETNTGSYSVLRPASVPSAPYAPKPLRSAILGFAVGLFAGIGLAFLLEQFDTRVRRPDEIATLLRQPILGRIPKLSHKLLGERLPVTMRYPEGTIAEAFRMVRTNLDFTAVDNAICSMAVTSCIKGEGKSISLANLAVTMAMAGKKVVIVDADLRRPRQHKIFDVGNQAGLSTVATGQTRLVDAIVPIELEPLDMGEQRDDFLAWARGADARSRLFLLPSGPLPPNPGEIVASRRFIAIIEELEHEADIVLVDTPAMLAVGDTSVIAAAVDGMVFLVDMHEIKKGQLSVAADQLLRLPTKILGVVVRTHGTRSSRYYYSPDYYYRHSYGSDGRRSKERRRRSGGRRATDTPFSAVDAPPTESGPPRG